MREDRRTKAQMVAQIDGGVDRSTMPAWNTLDYVKSGVRYIVYNDTTILTFLRSGGFIVHTGGWNTMSTRRKLNHFLPAGYSVETYRSNPYLHTSASSTLFKNTITVGPRGSIKSDYTEVEMKADRCTLNTYMRNFKTYGLPSAECHEPDITSDDMCRETMELWVVLGCRYRLVYKFAMGYHGVSWDSLIHYLHDVDRRDGKLSDFELGRMRRYVKHCLAH